MKVNKDNLNKKNVKSFIQANIRMFKVKINNSLNNEMFNIPDYIKEQIQWRSSIMNKECLSNGECLHCGCSLPDKLYADTGCSSNCYPEMINEEIWKIYKAGIDNDDSSNWVNVLNKIIENNKHLIKYDTMIVNDIKVKKGSVLKTTKIIDLGNVSVNSIDNISPSCSCVQVLNTNVNNGLTISLSINGMTKPIGKHSVDLTVRYNKISRFMITVNFEVYE